MRKPARQLSLVVVLIATSTLVAGAAGAQRTTAPVTNAAAAPRVAGVVVDSGGVPVPYADVRITTPDGRRFASSSDEAGRFHLSGLPAGPATLAVRRIGFRPYTQQIVLADTDATATAMRIPLAIAAAQLTGIEVSDSRDETDPALVGFYARRRTNNFGHFLDRAQIEATHAQRSSEALRTVPGVLIQPSRRVGNIVRVRNCRPTVWLDGVRLPGAELDEVTMVDDVAAVEIYKSLAGLPQQFVDRTNPCGAILVWSRTH